ncbi:antibiotic biosynthesis monooxygenase (plasmid) [Acaryochloris sp. 'Moss Beach']|uniref:antibiotic biosynthesis monooxygenase family protein n=1 Tax=Acaryochloris sp. 'Moss Beach' TaxID=2740837 RepID=UPI001F3A26E1|nr:antibiotic biosynthesis monooxygenase family protein [Acaryochloris sp. 'Moss Beach']UJB73254.1 antibiotic biosynthesis monooxygenase [Acaryochloris sp. 'Moss Beach']
MKSFLAISALTIVIAGLSSVNGFAQSPVRTATIDPSLQTLTMVNVLTPESGKQDEVIRLLQAGMDEEMKLQPGFISSTIHRSLNSDHVVVYAQWTDQAAVDAAVKVIQSGKAPNMQNVFSIASPDFHPYQVVSTHRSNSK